MRLGRDVQDLQRRLRLQRERGVSGQRRLRHAGALRLRLGVWGRHEPGNITGLRRLSHGEDMRTARLPVVGGKP